MHATAVSAGGVSALLIGPSGSGKSSTALQLLAFGATLVADDQCELFEKDGAVWVRRPATLPAMIEAWGVGLLPVPTVPETPVGLVVDMGHVSQARHPNPQTMVFFGHSIPKIDKVDASHFPATILLYLTQQSLTE